MELEKENDMYQKVREQLIKRTKLCKEKINENKTLTQKCQVNILFINIYYL